MKVAVLASLLRPISSVSNGGTEAFAHQLTEGLVEAGTDVTLFASSDSVTKAKLISVCSTAQTTGVFEGNIATNVLFESLQSSMALKQSHEFDILHNNYWHFFTLNNYAWSTDRPIITTMHNHFWTLPNLKDVFVKTHRKGKDVIVFSSQKARDLAKDLVDTEVIYHGIDMKPFPYSPQSKEYFLWFSRLTKNKGITYALDAAQQGNFPLVVAGGIPVRPQDLEYLETNVRPRLTGTVSYAGEPDDLQRTSLYQNAKALVFTTQVEEQFGFVSAEAMSCGTPVIAFNRGAIPEVVQDGVTGFIIDPDDSPRPGKGTWTIKTQGVEGIIEATKRIGEIDRAACRKRVEELFSRERMVLDYLSLYKKVLAR